MQNKIELVDAIVSLDNIVSTLELVMENMEQEYLDSKDGLEKHFFSRMDCVYLPALNLIQCSACNLLKEMRETTA